jgi:hypothetical protein
MYNLQKGKLIVKITGLLLFYTLQFFSCRDVQWQNKLKVETLKITQTTDVKIYAHVEVCNGIHFSAHEHLL